MSNAEIERLAKQMLAAEKDPDSQLARRHAAEWARVPWDMRGSIVDEAKRLESAAHTNSRKNANQPPPDAA
jgi:hypothetical protein